MSGIHCCVDFCTSYSSSGVSIHRFPVDGARRQKWIEFVRGAGGRSEWTPRTSSRICSLHFEPACYRHDVQDTTLPRLRRWLEPDALPTIYPSSRPGSVHSSFPKHPRLQDNGPNSFELDCNIGCSVEVATDPDTCVDVPLTQPTVCSQDNGLNFFEWDYSSGCNVEDATGPDTSVDMSLTQPTACSEVCRISAATSSKHTYCGLIAMRQWGATNDHTYCRICDVAVQTDRTQNTYKFSKGVQASRAKHVRSKATQCDLRSRPLGTICKAVNR